MRLNDGSAATPALTFEDGAGMYNHQGNVVFTTQLQATGFVGDGSGLSNIAAALDVIDASSVSSNVVYGDASGDLQIGANLVPTSNVAYNLGTELLRFKDLFLSGNTIDLGGSLIQSVLGNVVIGNLDVTNIRGDGSGLTGISIPPSINTITITDSSWNPIVDLALSTSSTGYVTIGGNNFEVGTTVSVGGTAAASITVVNSQLLRVSVNPKPSGTYDVVVQTGGGSVNEVNGVSFDPLPVWSTGSSLGHVFYEKAFSIPLSASDGASAITYSNTSALPPSTTLASNGVLQGNIVETSSTTYNFSVEAIDAQLQSALRSFSLSYVLFLVSGGTITTSGGFTYHTFTTNDTLTVSGEATIEFAVIGAGGGGGSDHGGGGGAGQVLVGSVVFTDGTYTVTIGPGGLGAPKYGYGQDGGSTSLGPYTAIGGGGGAPYNGPNGRSGASGGGAGGLATGTGGAAQSVSTGYAGGSTVASNYSAAGGGGAGGVGSAPTGSGTSSVGGVGGTAVNVFGNFYGGGGGGGSYTGAGGAGGGGGAGAGGTIHTTDGYDASPNTGSGGGGGGGNNTTDGYGGGTGGSGVVIVRYLS